ncbi:MAG: 3-deoxy-D-manno-octulosonic acid transferase [Elusimicrobia bacterium]|nr:3-deoxy-D-manno-octulosonic acid transferase [Elusimicrobiota bacterium]
MSYPLWLVTFLLYQLAFPLAAIFVFVKFILEDRASKLWEKPSQIRQRLGLVDYFRANNSRILWVHAASVGEVNAAAPLLKALKFKDPSLRIVLTASTAAGRERAETSGAVDRALLAPIDFYPSVRAFIRRMRPSDFLIVETELWPAALFAARLHGIGISIANGRMTERSFRRYRLARFFFRPLLETIQRAAVQTQADAQRLITLGARPSAVQVTGNLKYDVPLPEETAVSWARRQMRQLGWEGTLLWTAGSTRPGEEMVIAEAFLKLRAAYPGLRLILAPRHTERSRAAAAVLAQHGISFARLSANPPPSPNPDCLLVDETGRLAALYGVSDVAFVGGTLVPVGGHNLLEPAAASKPVLFGPFTASVDLEAQTLLSSGGGFRVRTAFDLSQTLERLFADPHFRKDAGRKARQAAVGLGGAVGRTLECLKLVC